MNDKGFTLIEVIISTAVMAIIGGLMTGIFYTVTSVNQREIASSEVTSQLNFVTQTIQRLVRESSNVEIEAGTSTTTLKLRMPDPAKDPTCITFASSSIRLAQGPDATNAENCTANATDLTNDKVVVDSLNFKKFTQYPGHDTVSFDVAMTYVSGDPTQQIQRTLQSAVARVSAATFDSNLLPGDTTFTLGQTGSTWQNIIVSDGTAANPSYTFGNNLGLGLFRADTDILGFSTAGVERLRIDATGTSTFAGNIFLAGATSTYRITNVASPASGSDAATKAYVDSATGSGLPSGTDGQTLRYSGSSLLANSLLYNSGSQIGINTTSPETFTMKISGTLGVSSIAFGTAGIITNDVVANLQDTIGAVAVDDTYVYYAGYVGWQGDTSLRIEKRYKTTGALVTAFDTDGAITYNPSAGEDSYMAMAIDSNYIYLSGLYGKPIGSGGGVIYIEKRDITTGALVTAFDTDGIATNDVAGGYEWINSMTVDSNYIYLAGLSHSYENWHIEKRDITTGALVTAFDTDGQIDSSISAGYDEATDIEVDSNYIYVSGYEDGYPNASYWRIEKRDKTTGALVTAFDTDGIVNVDPGAASAANEITIDSSYIYIVGTDHSVDASYGNHRIEKRNITTGALVTAFDTDGIVTENLGYYENPVMALVDSNYLYYASSVNNGSSYPMFVSKRDITTGALVTAFDTDGSVTNSTITVNSMAMDSESLYTAGTTNGSGAEFKMEKRYKDTGAFATSGSIYLQRGAIGIGRTPTTNALEVEGDASKTTAGSWLANSDAKIKTDINNITNALSTINALRPVKFKYTSEYMAEHPSIEDKYYYNFIAQEYQKIFPDAVKTGADGLLQIDTHNVEIYLTQGMKDLIEIVKEQNNRINELTDRIKKIEQ